MSISSSTQQTVTSFTYLSSLQILRGIAAIIVMLGHIVGKIKHEYPQESIPDYFLSFWKVSAVGVDVFFVLSGIVMVLVTSNYSNDTSYIRDFLKKRFVRIY
ncbi:acyltransferase, partial [Photobacterium sp. BZF1]|uniref:acyltransferase family protein n=1 Tax=Photobacterium sp. BZF1 TaxID=1904457 RepID=UPI0016534C27